MKTLLAVVSVSALSVLGSACSASSSDAKPTASADGGAGTDATGCARADPTCPSAVPSYATTIRPIFATVCASCHYPDSPYAETSLVTYDDVDHVYGAALGQVSACLMPPAGNVQLTDEQRGALLDWLACGAPNN